MPLPTTGNTGVQRLINSENTVTGNSQEVFAKKILDANETAAKIKEIPVKKDNKKK
jgi:hypothetical protein